MSGEFDQPTFADLRLVLPSSQDGTCTSGDLAGDGPPSKRQRTGLSLDDTRSFYAHKVILASKSAVIKAMLLRAKELRDLRAMGDGISIFLAPVECCGSVMLLVSPPTRQLIKDPQPETLELPVEQEELLACEVLFRSLYSDDLDEEVTSALSGEHGAGAKKATLLVQVYRLADRLEVCTDQCAHAISALGSEDCQSVDAVNYVFSLKGAAPGLVEHATIKVLIEKCMSQLVERFGAVWKLVGDNSLIAEFKQLGCLTVLSFFDSDKLEVKSEDQVLLLMAKWMGTAWAGRISKEQLEAFLNVLQLGQLTTPLLANLNVVAPWLPVDPVVLGRAAAWKCYQIRFPEKAASMPDGLQSVDGSSVAWFSDKRKYRTNGTLVNLCFSEGDLAKLLASVQHAGAQEDMQTIRVCRAAINGYDTFPTLSVQIISVGSKKMFVISVGFEFRTSADYMSEGIKTLAHVKADCRLGKGREPMGSVDDVVYAAHAWEVTRVDSLNDFSCLDSYLDEEGKLAVQFVSITID